MAQNSKIAWTTHTFNPWEGCTKVSPGCLHCYAEARANRFGRKWGKQGVRKMMSDAYWREPLKWNRKVAEEPFVCRKCGTRYLCESGGCAACDWDCEIVPYRERVFCASLADVFEGDDTMPESARAEVWNARMRLLQLIHDTPQLDWLLLTKRPENIVLVIAALMNRAYGVPVVESPFALWIERWLTRQFPPNVWIGTTVENQDAADKRLPLLLRIPARVRFLSCEPLLGKVDLGLDDQTYLCPQCRGRDTHYEVENPDDLASMACTRCGFRTEIGADFPVGSGIDWVICGGESGPKARPFHTDWAQDLKQQCDAAGIPFFMKQLGERTLFPGDDADKPLHLTHQQIGDLSWFPADLRVQTFPEVKP
jgi:protein gp37